jgi:hypothetical protein
VEVDVDHVEGWFDTADDDETSQRGAVGSLGEGQYLEGDVRGLVRLKKPVELVSHGLR